MARWDQYDFMKNCFINKEAIKKGDYGEAWFCFKAQLNVVLREKNTSTAAELNFETLEYLNLMLKAAVKRENKVLESYCLNFLGRQHNLMGQFEDAIQYFERNIPLSDKIKNPDLKGRAFIGCGYAYFHLKKYEEAVKSYNDAIDNAQRLDDQSRLLGAMTFLGRCFIEMGMWDEANDVFQRAMERGGQMDDLPKDLLCFVLFGIGRIYNQNGRYNEAVSNLKLSLDLATRLGFKNLKAEILLCLSTAMFNNGQRDKAIELINAALEIGETLQDNALVKNAEILKEEYKDTTKSEIKIENEGQGESEKGEIGKLENQVIEALVCPICLEVAERAVETSCCHNVYCEKCLSLVANGPCPQCRNQFKVLTSHICRRIIGNLPAVCSFVGCTAKLTRSELGEHEQRCGFRLYKCPAPKCIFEGLQKIYLMHLITEHKDAVVKQASNIFKKDEMNDEVDNDRIQAKVNEEGRQCRLGSTGKFYCGYLFGNSRCDCCDGYCGPNAGCNCAACMKLDIKAFKLTKGWLVNPDGSPCQQNSENGNFYCGRLAIPPSVDSDGFCGPDVGSNCDACRIVQSQLSGRYKDIWQ